MNDIQRNFHPRDLQSLEKELHQLTEGEVRFDAGSRSLYATDGSNYRQVPIGVVLPRNRNDIHQTISLCHKYNAPLLSRGGGTSLAGQCCNVAIVMDLSKYYNQVLQIDQDKKLVKVESGIVLDHMQEAIKKYDLVFGPDPSTHNHCTIGGMLGNNSCGVHSVMSQHAGYGARVSDNTESMTILTYDGVKMEVGPTSPADLEKIIQEGGRKGEIYQKLRDLRDRHADRIRKGFPKIPRRVSGYNLDELLPENGFNVARALVGTEGTCVTVLDATMKLLPRPKARSLLVLGYPDVYDAGSHVADIMQYKPTGLEGIDRMLIGYMQKKGLNMDDLSLLPDGDGWLLVEFGGDTRDEADAKARDLMNNLENKQDKPSMSLFKDPKQEAKIWEIRESGLGATAFIPGNDDTWPGWEDSAVHPEKVGEYLKDLRGLFHDHGYEASLYGHFGQGCIHCRIDFDLKTVEGLKRYEQFTIDATDLVKKYGGCISGEHGDGQSRADRLTQLYGKELVQAFREFKSIWDPKGRMNPGKVVNPYGQLENLRLGTHYHPRDEFTHFKFPEDEGSFARATLRCVGVGECRRTEGGTMCPSYRATREEKDTTRGRARMLFEMLQGETVDKGWKDKHVKESLDLCLACKGCKGDCPVNVDMATYKAEFLSHYYQGRLRPRSAYAFGWIYWWSRLASLAPGLANFFTQTPGFSHIAKWIAGVDMARSIPKFASRTFRNWFGSLRREKTGKPKVILWTDTFNNFFLPETLKAGLEVLEGAGFSVMIPGRSLCCGRPLFDFGMIPTAKRLLKEILNTLRPEIRAGTPVVGLEPSCIAVFRDELCNLFPHDEDALRLKKQTFTLAEFLQEKTSDFTVPVFQQKALVHGHCQHKAIMQFNSEESLLKDMKLDYILPDSGCCGMAGYFGYKKGDHYRISVRAGEQVLLPAVRNTGKDDLIIADGFSCREQIEQQTGRRTHHLAEVIRMAMNQRKEKAREKQRQKEPELEKSSHEN